MLLALSIVSEQGAALGPTAYKVFDERGGSIGRVAGNDWVLPDANNFVSSKHARVTAINGVFYLEDTSSNGTFINAPDRLTSRQEPQRLSDGDRLYIGDYEIIVQLIPSAPTEARPRATEAVAPTVLNSPAPSSLGLGTVDPLAALSGTPPPSPSPSAPASPPPTPSIPAQPSSSAARSAPKQSAASTPAASDAVSILTALGLNPEHVDPAVQQQLGTILRLTVQGLVEVLRSRAEVKNSFRLPTTSIKPVENNPLKFSLNADDALQSLFIRRNAGYLGPVEAVKEGFDDIAAHQAAVLTGIRAGFNAILAKLHPQKLEDLYERKLKRTAMLGLGNKAKYWEMYRAQFEEIDRDREAHFQLLFGEEFALAYNNHLQKLAAEARSRK
jgi:predicted component of type VI protein secretion system